MRQSKIVQQILRLTYFLDEPIQLINVNCCSRKSNILLVKLVNSTWETGHTLDRCEPDRRNTVAKTVTGTTDAKCDQNWICSHYAIYQLLTKHKTAEEFWKTVPIEQHW